MTEKLLFKTMQEVLDAVPLSPHETNKISAGILDKNNSDLRIIHTNNWPEIIDQKIGREQKIGNSSGTVHAETNTIFNAPFATQNCSIFITDPFCPNCAKNIVEAGIKKIYIDRDGFDRDFFKRRGDHFETMSMRIVEQAGVSVYAVNMSEQSIKIIHEPELGYIPPIDNPLIIEEVLEASQDIFNALIEKAQSSSDEKKFAVALTKDKNGKIHSIISSAHIVEGFTIKDKDQTIDLLSRPSKYSFIQEPVNRMMMQLSRYGLTLINGFLYCSQVPTSREQVNMVGAEINEIYIGDHEKSRDEHGLLAKNLLNEKKIITYLDIE